MEVINFEYLAYFASIFQLLSYFIDILFTK